nr:UDP-N-acetylenolpyruvoylglucosamine reductase [Aquabacterium sp.]
MHTPSAGNSSPVSSALLDLERGASLREFNTFGLPATASTLVHVHSEADVKRVVNDPELGRAPKFILGGGSNLVLTQDVERCVLKVEIKGIRLLSAQDDAWI